MSFALNQYRRLSSFLFRLTWMTALMNDEQQRKKSKHFFSNACGRFSVFRFFGFPKKQIAFTSDNACCYFGVVIFAILVIGLDHLTHMNTLEDMLWRFFLLLLSLSFRKILMMPLSSSGMIKEETENTSFGKVVCIRVYFRVHDRICDVH